MNAVVRAIRTWIQVFVGLLLAGWVDVASFDDALSVAQTALIASIPAALALVQNLVEDSSIPIEIPK